MRRSMISVLVLTGIGLAACSRQSDEQPTPAQAASSAAATAGKMRPEPGRYRITTKVTNVSIPGLPPAAAAQAKKMFSATGHSSEFCLTPEKADLGYEEMTKRAAEGNCKYDSFSAEGGKLDAAMTCETGKGMTTKSRVTGTFSPTGSNMTMVTDTNAQGMPGGGMHIEGAVVTERLGDCA